MKKIFIFFFSSLSLIIFSQKKITIEKIPADPPVGIKSIDASNFKVQLDKLNNRINFSFNLTGDYYRTQTTVYKNFVSEENRIAYGVKEDEAWYDPIHYPPGYIYEDWNYNPNNSAFQSAAKYILVLEAWEITNSPKLTKTLIYNPPIETPNLVATAFQVYSSLSGVKIFDSNTSNNVPQLQKNASYKFVVRVNKTGNANVNNLRIDLCQYDVLLGNYPSVSPKAVQTQYINFFQEQNIIDVTFETTITDFGSNSFMGIAFHLDKDNSIIETNENDNIKLLQAGYHNRTTNMKDITEVFVYDTNGKLLKKVETTSDDKEFVKVKSQLNAGKYILKSNEKSLQVLIR